MFALTKGAVVLAVISVALYVMALIRDEIFTTSWLGLMDIHCGWESVHYDENADFAILYGEGGVRYSDMGLTSQMTVGIVWLLSGIISILVGTLGTGATVKRVWSNADGIGCSSCNFGCVYYVAGVFALIGCVSVFLNGSEGCSAQAEAGSSLKMAIGACIIYFFAGGLVTADKSREEATGSTPGGMDAVERAPLSTV